MIKLSLITAIADILTLVISTFFLLKNLKNVKKSAKYLIWLVIYVLYIVPLYIDYLYILPEYLDIVNGFVISRSDDLTNVLFDFFFLFLQYGLLYKNKKDNTSDFDTSFTLTSRCRKLLYLGTTFAPLVVILLIRQYFLLYTFGWRELEIIEPPRFYDYAEQLCYFSSSCAILLFFEKRKKLVLNIFQKCLTFGLLYVSLSIQGKRAILFYVMICVCIVLYFEFIGRLRNNRSWKPFLLYVFIVGGVAAFYMVILSMEVKITRAGRESDDTNRMVTSLRVDFFRDDRVRMAFYSDLHPQQMQILQYRGQTLIPDLFGLWPINYLRDRIGVGRKTYQTYFTCALSGENVNSPTAIRDSNWMTVTFISEIISNFTFVLAFFIIPFFCLKVSRLINRLKYPFNILSVFAFVLLNLFDTTYVIVFIEFSIIYYLLLKKRRIRRNAVVNNNTSL